MTKSERNLLIIKAYQELQKTRHPTTKDIREIGEKYGLKETTTRCIVARGMVYSRPDELWDKLIQNLWNRSLRI